MKTQILIKLVRYWNVIRLAVSLTIAIVLAITGAVAPLEKKPVGDEDAAV